MHHLLARPVVNVLFVECNYRVAIAKPGTMTGCARSGRQNVDMIVSFGDRYADAVDAAALFGLNIVELGFGEEGRMRIELMKHPLYRVLAQVLQINFACVAFLDFGERLFEIVRQLFGQIRIRIGNVWGARRYIVAASQR